MPSGSTSSLTGSDNRACWVGYGDGSLQGYLARTCAPVLWLDIPLARDTVDGLYCRLSILPLQHRAIEARLNIRGW